MNLHSRSREERNWEPENSGFRKEPFIPAAKIKRLKTVRWLVLFQVKDLALERMEDVFWDTLLR